MQFLKNSTIKTFSATIFSIFLAVFALITSRYCSEANPIWNTVSTSANNLSSNASYTNPAFELPIIALSPTEKHFVESDSSANNEIEIINKRDLSNTNNKHHITCINFETYAQDPVVSLANPYTLISEESSSKDPNLILTINGCENDKIDFFGLHKLCPLRKLGLTVETRLFYLQTEIGKFGVYNESNSGKLYSEKVELISKMKDEFYRNQEKCMEEIEYCESWKDVAEDEIKKLELLFNKCNKENFKNIERFQEYRKRAAHIELFVFCHIANSNALGN